MFSPCMATMSRVHDSQILSCLRPHAARSLVPTCSMRSLALPTSRRVPAPGEMATVVRGRPSLLGMALLPLAVVAVGAGQSG